MRIGLSARCSQQITRRHGAEGFGLPIRFASGSRLCRPELWRLHSAGSQHDSRRRCERLLRQRTVGRPKVIFPPRPPPIGLKIILLSGTSRCTAPLRRSFIGCCRRTVRGSKQPAIAVVEGRRSRLRIHDRWKSGGAWRTGRNFAAGMSGALRTSSTTRAIWSALPIFQMVDLEELDDPD